MYCKTILTRSRLIFGLLGFAWLLGGCTRSLVQTTVQTDGSWTRALKFTSNAALEGQQPAPLEDVFRMPGGVSWITRRTTTKEDITYTAQRQLKAGARLSGDVAVKVDHALGLSNQVSVREVAPGEWEYREVLRPTKALTADLKDLDNPNLPENLATLRMLREALPPALATHENLLDLLHVYNRALVTLLFGPPSPLLPDLIIQSDLGELEAQQRFNAVMSARLQAKFGVRLTEAQRLATTQKIVNFFLHTVQATARSKTKSSASDKPDSAQNGLLANLTFTVQMPGKIISSNGTVNSSTHTAFWGLYPEAAAVGDIVLTATCQVPLTAVSK